MQLLSYSIAMTTDIHVHQPDPEDFSFSIKNIQKGYALIHLMARNPQMAQAIDNYRKISGSPVAAQALMPEYSSRSLARHIRDLRRAATQWKKDVAGDEGQFQRSYRQLVKAASDDCEPALAAVEEMAGMFKRALSEEGDHRTLLTIAGVEREELISNYRHLSRLRHALKNFMASIAPVHEVGNMVIGPDTEEARRMLGRPVRRQDNPNFENEVRFFGAIGMLGEEKEEILQELAKVNPPERAAELRSSFLRVCDALTGYATFAVEDPKRAIAAMQKDIPGCLDAIAKVQEQLGGADAGALEILSHCIGSLKRSGPDQAK